MSHHEFRRVALVVLLFLAGGIPAFADSAPRPRTSLAVREDERSSPAAVVLAFDWSIGKFVASGGRARIVQIGVAVMCLALFIMIRKLC